MPPHMANTQIIDQIVGELFGLTSPKIDESRRTSIRGLIESTVNGDTIEADLVINATIK
jgi:hypothetical protein